LFRFVPICSESGTPLSITAYIRKQAARSTLSRMPGAEKWGRIWGAPSERFRLNARLGIPLPRGFPACSNLTSPASFPWGYRSVGGVMLTISTTTERENNIRGFQQLVVDAVELAGSISPTLKAQLVFVLGPTFPSEVSPTIDQQKVSLPAVLRMFMYARHEADRFSDLQNARQSLDTCVAFLVDRASCSQFEPTNKFH
jgi:hypothetical protein